MEGPVNNSRRIARNTAWLAVRMAVATAVGLLASRVALNALGADDYGVYAVVGSLTASLAFLNTTMAGAVSRFLAFSHGRGDNAGLKRNFAAALAAHLIIAAVAVVIAETAGFWFLESRLNIPQGLATQSRWLLQFSILSMAATIIQTPYMAAIIAREQMKAFAWIEMGLTVCKLAVALSATMLPQASRLVIYGALMCVVYVLTATAYATLSRHRYQECRQSPSLDKSTLKPLLAFSAIDLYGNLCVSGRTQGLNWLINIFFSVAYNAASSLAAVVNNSILGLASAVTSAFRPHAVKLYAAGDIKKLSRLMGTVTAAAVVAFSVVAAPCYIAASELLEAWLGDVPPSTTEFTRLILIQSLFAIPVTVISVAIHATGRIMRLSLINGTIYLSAVPLAWLVFNHGGGPEWAYIISATTTAVAFFSTFLIARALIPSLPCAMLLGRALAAIVLSVAIAAFSSALCGSIQSEWPRILATAAVNAAMLIALAAALLLSRRDRRAIMSALQ